MFLAWTSVRRGNGKLIDDALTGKRSLKTHEGNTGLVYRTTPGTVTLRAGHAYRISYAYQSSHAGAFEWVTGYDAPDSVETRRTAIGEQRSTGRFTETVTAGCGDTWVGLRMRADAPEGSDFVLDDFAVTDLGPAPERPACATLRLATAAEALEPGAANDVEAVFTSHETGTAEQVEVSLDLPEGWASDLDWVSAENGWGPVERDTANGGTGAGDGPVLTVGGVTYAKGLGTHAPARVRYFLGGRCDSFTAEVGVDDGQGTRGSVRFAVVADGAQKGLSPVLRASDSAYALAADVTGARYVDLVADDGGDGNGNDHADWGQRPLPLRRLRGAELMQIKRRALLLTAASAGTRLPPGRDRDARPRLPHRHGAHRHLAPAHPSGITQSYSRLWTTAQACLQQGTGSTGDASLLADVLRGIRGGERPGPPPRPYRYPLGQRATAHRRAPGDRPGPPRALGDPGRRHRRGDLHRPPTARPCHSWDGMCEP